MNAYDEAVERQGIGAIIRAVQAAGEAEAYADQTGGWIMVAVWTRPDGRTFAAIDEGNHAAVGEYVNAQHYEDPDEVPEGEWVEPFNRNFPDAESVGAWVRNGYREVTIVDAPAEIRALAADYASPGKVGEHLAALATGAPVAAWDVCSATTDTEWEARDRETHDVPEDVATDMQTIRAYLSQVLATP